jgi:hypothetical protein
MRCMPYHSKAFHAVCTVWPITSSTSNSLFPVLQVSAEQIRIELTTQHPGGGGGGGGGDRSVRSCCLSGFRLLKLDSSTAIAKASKKKRTLSVSVQYL